MEIDTIKEIIQSWDEMLSESMKKFIHYRSMRNFVLHFDEIKHQNARGDILSLLGDYIDEVQSNSYDYDAKGGYDLARKYLLRLCDYYRKDSHFVTFLKLKTVFLWGILGDSLLYLSGVSWRYWNIPIVTVGLFLYYLYVVAFKEKSGRVYGLYY